MLRYGTAILLKCVVQTTLFKSIVTILLFFQWRKLIFVCCLWSLSRHYERIGLFRVPDAEGRLADIESMEQGRSVLLDMVHKGLR